MTTQPERLPLDDLTSDALDALYDRLEAAEATKLARQLNTCREAHATATVRVAQYADRAIENGKRADTAEARVRELEAGRDGLLKATADLVTSIGYARHTLATEVLGQSGASEDMSLDQIVVHVIAEHRADQSTIRRLTAGQCTHSLAVCEQHHTTPVAGCPYPRCLAAKGREQRAVIAPGGPKPCRGARTGHYPGCPTRTTTTEPT